MDSIRRTGILVATVGWLTLGPMPARAQQSDERTLSPYFLVEGGRSAGIEPLPLEGTEVVANVSGVIADVLVRQTYRNRGELPINARYVFPASTRAAVHGLSIQLGEKRVVAKIEERDRAAAEFEQARAEGKTATLLEQARPNLFTMAIANIMPGDRVLVELRYSELLVPSEGVYQFVYPTVAGPRYSGDADLETDAGARAATPVAYLPAPEAPPQSFALRVNLSTGVPLADLRCNTHAVTIARPEPNLARVALTDEGSGGDRDFVLDYRLAGQQVDGGLMLYQGERENFFLLMLQPPARVQVDEIPPREYVFVLDVSGSMYGFPLDTAKALMKDLLAGLRPSDSFNVLFFSGGSYQMTPRSLPATPDNVARALHIVSQAQSGGGTELEAALQQALNLPRAEHVSRSLVLVTDGYIAQERGAFELIAKHLPDANFFAFGIGSSVNRYLIEGLARAGQGEPFIVTEPAEARATAQRFRRYIESPVLTDIRVRYRDFEAYDVEPQQQPDLFAERPLMLFGKWRGPRRGTIEISGSTPGGAFGKSVAVADAPMRQEHAALPQLWARGRIARLSDFNVEGDDAEAVREVTALGLGYSLLTKYTSFIAVLERVRNREQPTTDVAQPSPLPLGMSDFAADGEYDSGAEPELALLLALMLGAFGLVALRRRTREARGGA
jgi:Ca-activated chloride channel family protein